MSEILPLILMWLISALVLGSFLGQRLKKMCNEQTTEYNELRTFRDGDLQNSGAAGGKADSERKAAG